MAALLCDDTVIKSRMFETISSTSLDLNTVGLLETVNGCRLQEICFWYFEGIETIRRLAVLFPTIKTLATLGSCLPPDGNCSLDEYINCFGEFPSLENLCDVLLWDTIQAQTADKKEETLIRKLYTRCSTLKTIRPIIGPRAEIVFFRDGLDVTWKLTENLDF